MESQSDYDRAVCRAEEKMRFYSHLIVYALVNTMLIFINLLNNPQKIWFYWPLVGWGIGLLLHAMKVFGSSNSSRLKQRLIQHELEKKTEASTDCPSNKTSEKDTH